MPGSMTQVVYHPIPTSNHNLHYCIVLLGALYIILFLHQTTTPNRGCKGLLCCISSYSYIKPQPTTSVFDVVSSCISSYSYIKPQHKIGLQCWQGCCISSYSYIKPQLVMMQRSMTSCCISSYSYIKPQPRLNLSLYFNNLCTVFDLRSGSLCGMLRQKY